jgi:hypothetical protein
MINTDQFHLAAMKVIVLKVNQYQAMIHIVPIFPLKLKGDDWQPAVGQVQKDIMATVASLSLIICCLDYHSNQPREYVKIRYADDKIKVVNVMNMPKTRQLNIHF